MIYIPIGLFSYFECEHNQYNNARLLPAQFNTCTAPNNFQVNFNTDAYNNSQASELLQDQCSTCTVPDFMWNFLFCQQMDEEEDEDEDDEGEDDEESDTNDDELDTDMMDDRDSADDASNCKYAW